MSDDTPDLGKRLLRDLDPAHEGTTHGIKGLTAEERKYLAECVRLRQAWRSYSVLVSKPFIDHDNAVKAVIEQLGRIMRGEADDE